MVVLIVDDEPTTRRGMERVLREAGHAPESLEDAGKALARLIEATPDVLITDLIMPGMSGLDLIASARAVHPYLPVIVMTAQGDIESAVAAMRLGADDYLTKPFDLDTVALAIDRAVERERVFRERDHLRHQSDFTRAMVGALADPDALGETIVDELMKALGDACVLHMRSEDGGHLDGVASRSTPPLESLVSQLHSSRLDIDEVTRDLYDVRPRESWAPRPAKDLADHLLRSGFFISAPLQSTDGVQGVVSVARAPTRQPFGKHDAALLGELADRATLTLMNARLFRDLQRELEQRRTAEQSLRETQQQLLHAQKMEAVGRLAGGIAHDFNNVLSIVLSYAGMLADDMPAEDARRDDVQEILDAGARAADLTQKLMAFSRRQVLAPAVVDLSVLVRGADRMLRSVVGEAIQLDTSLADDLRATQVDPGQVEQVLMNLVINARDAIDGRGRIEIRTFNADADGEAPEPALQSKAHVALAIQDDGSGMDAVTQAHAFEPFFTTKPPGQGTGLGLSTVHGIVEQSGGFIRMRTAPGVGTTFEVYFPVTDQPVQEKAPRTARPERGFETILVVDDEDGVRKIAATILKRRGYQVLVAATPAEALRIAEDSSLGIDLLVTDVVMPQMTGPELAAAFAASNPELRVLFTSGYPGDWPPRVGAATGFLQKPITPTALGEKVRELLDR